MMGASMHVVYRAGGISGPKHFNSPVTQDDVHSPMPLEACSFSRDTRRC